MGTTIDNIQIEIQSSSTNAAKGIDDLASSLERLKSNGAFKSVSTNLNHLSTALKNLPNVHNASNSLRTLANSIEKLKSVGTVSGLTNSLSKLPTALKSLDNINLERAAPQIQKVVDALGPLSSMKSGGIGTMVNSLKNLDKVTESLSEESITKFAAKIKELDTHLGPLSQKMTTIQAGLKGLNASFKQTSVAVDNVNAKVKVNMFNLANLTTVFSAVSGALQTLIQKFSNAVHQASQWDGVEYQFGNAFGEQADLYYEKITMITDALKLDKQMFMENSAMATSMLTGFGVNNVDARKMGLGYTELAYDIWAAYNNVYESFDGADGVMAAIRSAIAGEVEPIRRAGFTIVESTLEQTAANHGLEISIEKATEAQKSYLRYLSLVDQAQSKGVIGTYASEMKTAEGMMRTFSQQLSSLTRAFGSLFIPILVKVMPYVQAFVELLQEGVFWLAGLLGVEIQKVDFSDYKTGKDAVAGVGDAAGTTADQLGEATKAAKELKNATLGIDELNVISPTSSTGSSGSGSGVGSGGGGFEGLDVDSLWDQTIFDSIQSDVDAIKEKLRGWMPVIAGVGTALAGLKLKNLLDDIDIAGFKLSNLGKVVSVAGITIAVGKLVWDFTGAYLEGGNEADLLKALGTTALGVALAGYLAGKPGASFTLLVSGVVTLSKLVVEIAEGTVEWNDTESIITGLVGGIETAIGAVFTWKTFAPIIKAAWPKIVAAAAPTLGAAAPYIGIAALVVGGIVLAFVDYDFTEIGYTIGNKIGEAIRSVVSWIGEKFTEAWNWIAESLDIDSVWDFLYVAFVPGVFWERISPELGELFNNLDTWLGEKIENLKGNINEFFGGFFDGLFDGLGLDMTWAKEFADIFDLDYVEIITGIMNPFSLGDNIMAGIKKGIDSNTKITAIKDKLSEMWENAKTWWDKKPGLSSYVPIIGNIAGKLSTAWTDAKNWWNEKRSSLSYTPSIGKIWEKLKSAWTSAKDWWNKSRSNLSYTPTIGSISSKLSSAWTSAKNWWSKHRSSLSYTPSIGSIKDKVVSAWNSAKKWWSSNAKLSTKLDIKVPKIEVKWDTASAFGKSFKYPTGFKLTFAKDGGVFDAGSLIWAGEHGAEIVANASGGKTGVMNVQQMQDAVYEGVYAAVIAAMRGYSGSGEQSVNVYLDGKQITSVVEKRQRERGASILGNEVYSY